MREFDLNITIKTKVIEKIEEIEIVISVYQDLYKKDKGLNELICEYMEDYMYDKYCSCSFNESKNYCDCGCGDWGYEFDIVSIGGQKGGEL